MTGLKKYSALAFALTATLALAACGGADGVASPGEGGFGGGGGGGGGGTGGGGTGGGGAAADCPTGFANAGEINALVGGTLRVCRLPSLITGTLQVPLRAGTIYSVSGRTDVGEDRGGNAGAPIPGAQQGVLNIDPGVRIFGTSGSDYIIVNRGSRIVAEGSATQPIIFTSRQNIEGSTTTDSIGQWGGLVLAGRAKISNCTAAQYGTPACESPTEGTTALHGGNNDGDSSGVLKYVRLMFSGFSVVPNRELNGITFAGVGNGTVVQYVQVHNSSDDGIEFFGGTVNLKNIVLTGNDDDSLDTDEGYRGGLQYGIVVQRSGGGDRMIEASYFSLASTNPKPSPQISNFTFVGRSSSSARWIFNTGTDVKLYNSVVTSPTGTAGACLDIDNMPDTIGTFRSVFMSCPTAFDADADNEAAIFTDASNTANGTSTLTSVFINGANETAVVATNPVPLNALAFSPVTYIGGVKDSADNWYAGWTCSPLIGQAAC
jgi:hypothetical protein